MQNRRNDDGMTTVAYMLATGLSLVVLTWCTMFIIASYTRAAVRGASERATRSAVVEFTRSQNESEAKLACESTFNVDISAALPGSMRNNLSSRCSMTGGRIQVTTNGDLSSLGPLFVNSTLNESTSRSLETLP